MGKHRDALELADALADAARDGAEYYQVQYCENPQLVKSAIFREKFTKLRFFY